MPDHFSFSPEGIGERIKEFRAIRGFSLTELGRRAHVSGPQLSRIETGKRSASPSVLASIARVLGVNVAVLHGQPYIHMLQQDQLDAMLTPVSSALGSWDIPPDDVPPRTLEALEGEVRRIVDLRVKTAFAQIAADLPALIMDAAVMAQTLSAPGHDRERAHAVQAELGRTAAILAYRLGFMDLAHFALSRMALAAAHSGDPRQVAIERFERAQMTHAIQSRADRGAALMRVALGDLDDDGTRVTRAVRGSLLLRASGLALQQRDKSGASDFLGQAEELSEQVGDVPEYSLMFGPWMVQCALMGMENQRDDHGAALRRAATMRTPEGCAPTFVAHFHIRKARAQAWTARHDESLESLHEAKRLAPQLTRYHPQVHEAVGTMLRARVGVRDPLRDFAKWSGV